MSKTQLQILFLICFFIFLLIAVLFLDLRSGFSLEKLRNIISNHSVTGVLLFIVLFTLGNFIQIPGVIFLSAAVITLGKTYGGLVTYAAAVISCTVSFVVIRFMGGDLLRKMDYQWASNIFNQLDKRPIRSVFILRSVFQTQPMLNYALALSRVQFKKHLIATVFALPLPLFLYCFFFEFLAKSLGVEY